MYTVYTYVHIWSFLCIYIYIRCTSVIFIHTYMWLMHHCNSSAARTACIDAVNLCKGASSACLSLSCNAQACQTRDWKFESSPKKIWNNTNNVHFKSLHFCVQLISWSRLCFGPLFQVSVQRFAFLNMWTQELRNHTGREIPSFGRRPTVCFLGKFEL